jgi:hypothetical protein
LPFETQPYQEDGDQHSHAHQLQITGTCWAYTASLQTRPQTFLLQGVFDGLAAIETRPGRGDWHQRQLRDDAHMRRKVVEHRQHAQQWIGPFLILLANFC